MSDETDERQGDGSAPAGGHRIDADASRIVVHTKATGLLARLAHDLELEASGFEGELDVDGEQYRAELRFPVAALRVVGVLRKGEVDRTVLSASDHDEIRERLDELVFPDTHTVVVRLEGEGRDRAMASVELPSGRQRVLARHRVAERSAGGHEVSGRCGLSLQALGIKEIKGPLGAFKVHDDVEVVYRVVVR
jgi:hypothetical protein